MKGVVPRIAVEEGGSRGPRQEQVFRGNNIAREIRRGCAIMRACKCKQQQHDGHRAGTCPQLHKSVQERGATIRSRRVRWDDKTHNEAGSPYRQPITAVCIVYIPRQCLVESHADHPPPRVALRPPVFWCGTKYSLFVTIFRVFSRWREECCDRAR